MSLIHYTKVSLFYSTVITEHIDAFSPHLARVQKFRRRGNRVLPFATIHHELPPLPHNCKMQLSRINSPQRAVFTFTFVLRVCSANRCKYDHPRQLDHVRNLHCCDAISSQLALPTCYPPTKIRLVGHVECKSEIHI